MKNVVMVAPDFAPSSLPPAIRARFFANNLREFGWEPTVLTTQSEFYDWQVDPENEKLLQPSMSVLRTQALRSSWTRKLGIGDVGIRSVWFQWQALKKLCREGKVDLVFIAVPPYVSMVLGRLAYQKFGIPYVVDYIDPWVTEYYWKLPKEQRPPKWAMSYAMARILEPFALKHVGHITGVSKGTTDGVVGMYDHLSPNDASEIPYGAEPADFAYAAANPRPNPIFKKDDGLFHMSYVGACIPGMHPTVKAIFRAVKMGLNIRPDLFSKLRLHFVGTSYAPSGTAPALIPSMAREFGVESLVDERSSRVSYLDSLQIMSDSAGLFLIGSDEPHYTASKVFPYMLSGRPLFAVFHEASSVVKILEGYDRAKVVKFSDQTQLDDKVEDLLNALIVILKDPQTDIQNDKSELEPFTTKAMTARLARAFDCAMLKRQSTADFGVADSPCRDNHST